MNANVNANRPRHATALALCLTTGALASMETQPTHPVKYSASRALTSGTRLGTYEILDALGAGGMGEVYRAKDLRLGREVALKVLPAEVASSPDHVSRLEREARTVAGLNHPNIVVLFSFEEEASLRFLTMELVEGQTLSTLVSPGGIPLPKLLDLAIPLTAALMAAHERGVIHRDLKPQNVMMTRAGDVKVLDFGLAKLMVADASAQDLTVTATTALTGDGNVVGTVPYMAPEQLRGESVDARSDLFSLGVILYELATGRRPFLGHSAAELASSILRDTPEPISRIRADLPVDFGRIVSQCLEKSPRERVQTALELNKAFHRLRKVIERGEPWQSELEMLASIAVLPFVNRSASADDEYFSDGLADEILNVLSKIKGLRVTARSSAFMFKGKQVAAQEIGRALNVATLLEGSVRKAGNRIRVSVQLVNVLDSSQRWSETYDRTLEDIFAVQDDIARSVVKELRAALLGSEPESEASGVAKEEVARASKGRAADPEAHRLYLLARHLLDRGTREDVAAGIESLKEALRLDPQYALAWVELGNAYPREADMGWVPVAEGYGRGLDAVSRALSLEPDLAEAHAQLGRIRMLHEWDWHGAEEAYTRSLELAPGNPSALRGAGALSSTLGRGEECILLTRRSLERDPFSAAAYVRLGMELHAVARFTEAQIAYRKALELAPHRGAVHAHMALALLGEGRGREAVPEMMCEPHAGFRLWAQAIIHHEMGQGEESSAALRELVARHAEGGAFQIAEAHGARGEPDIAFEWLERAFAERDGGIAELKPSPRLRSLHSDPRWEALLKKAGLH